MPYLFVATVQYSAGKYTFNPSDLTTKFPFLQGKIVTGKVVSTYRDGRMIRIDKELRFTVQDRAPPLAEISKPNPLKSRGFPLPAEVLLVVHKYEAAGRLDTLSSITRRAAHSSVDSLSASGQEPC